MTNSSNPAISRGDTRERAEACVRPHDTCACVAGGPPVDGITTCTPVDGLSDQRIYEFVGDPVKHLDYSDTGTSSYHAATHLPEFEARDPTAHCPLADDSDQCCQKKGDYVLTFDMGPPQATGYIWDTLGLGLGLGGCALPSAPTAFCMAGEKSLFAKVPSTPSSPRYVE